MSKIQLPAEKICSTLEHNFDQFCMVSMRRSPSAVATKNIFGKNVRSRGPFEAQSQGPDSGKGDLQYELQGRCFVPWQQLKDIERS